MATILTYADIARAAYKKPVAFYPEGHLIQGWNVKQEDWEDGSVLLGNGFQGGVFQSNDEIVIPATLRVQSDNTNDRSYKISLFFPSIKHTRSRQQHNFHSLSWGFIRSLDRKGDRQQPIENDDHTDDTGPVEVGGSTDNLQENPLKSISPYLSITVGQVSFCATEWYHGVFLHGCRRQF